MHILMRRYCLALLASFGNLQALDLQQFTHPLYDQSKTFSDLQATHASQQKRCLRRHSNNEPEVLLCLDRHNTDLLQLLYFSDQGQLQAQCSILADGHCLTFHGPTFHYGINGNIKAELSYNQGKLEGIGKLYWSNGNLKQQAVYKHGQAHGPYILYNSLGDAVEQGLYQEGKRTGTSLRFDKNGAILEQLRFSEGLPHGQSVYLDTKGQMQLKKIYWHGFLHAGIAPAFEVFRKDQSVYLKAHYFLSHPFRTWTLFDPASKAYADIKWSSYKVHAEFKVGSNSSSCQWNQGLLQAPSTVLHSNGKTALKWHKLKDRHYQLLGYSPSGELLIDEQYTAIKDKWVADGVFKATTSQAQPTLITHWEKGTITQSQRFHQGALVAHYRPQSPLLNITLSPSGDLHTLAINCPQISLRKIKLSFDTSGTLEGLEQSKQSKPIGWQYKLGQIQYYRDSCQYLWKEQEDGLELIYCERDRNGKQVYQIAFDSQGRCAKECFWQDDKPCKTWSAWSEGILIEQVAYKEGFKDGLQRLWHPNGQLAFESLYQRGMLCGKQRGWHPNGRLQLEQLYKDSNLHGPMSIWDSRGQLYLSCSYERGLLHGHFRQRLSDDRALECRYEHGLLEGPYKAYYPSRNGKAQVAFECHYHKGLREGPANDWSAQGVLLRHTPYSSGMINGTIVQRRNDGSLWAELSCEKNLLHGFVSVYSLQGKPLQKSQFVKGLEEGEQQVFDSHGLLIAINPYRQGTLHGLQKRFNPQTQKLIYEAQYVDGKKDGICKKYDENGLLVIEMKFDKDQLLYKKKF